ncbi:MAG: ammonium transporter [Lactobacillales bacterium]|jgi:Amt family ammonium transporter|nr:ammonium transporter [Lactobacillales bacterium]
MGYANIAFVIICSALVFLMTPALAFFYGGLARRKNIVNTMMMSVFCLGIVTIIWLAVGYSISFSGEGTFFGNFGNFFLHGIDTMAGPGKDGAIPDALFVVFQMMFAYITTGILTGSAVGRMRFNALFIFIAIWVVVVYSPLAHMVWGGGLLAQIGSIDFAGGNVVHISSGVSGLVLAIFVGKRRDFGVGEHRPHNIPFVLLGAGLLTFGWIGFNSGSALAANGLAVHALLTTMAAAGSAMTSWMFIEKIVVGKPTLVGAATGLVAGLVAITPGAGFVSFWSSIIIGLFVSPFCFFFISKIKPKLGLDDALDAFGCHGVGGIYGGLMTGIFAVKHVGGVSGVLEGNIGLLGSQALAILFTVVFAGVMSFIIIKVISLFVKVRVSDREEAIGMDDTEHAETAYPTFMGLDS